MAQTDQLKSHLAPAQRRNSPVPPVFIVNAALRLRRFFLRAADAVVPSYMSVYDRFMGAAHTMLVHSAARLRIPDHLAEGPLTSAELARRTQSDPDVMERVMLALVAIGVFRRRSDGRFINNRASKGMITGATGGVRGFAEFFGYEPVMRAWARLPQTPRDGRQAFKVETICLQQARQALLAAALFSEKARVKCGLNAALLRDRFQGMGKVQVWCVYSSTSLTVTQTPLPTGGGTPTVSSKISEPPSRSATTPSSCTLSSVPQSLMPSGVISMECGRLSTITPTRVHSTQSKTLNSTSWTP